MPCGGVGPVSHLAHPTGLAFADYATYIQLHTMRSFLTGPEVDFRADIGVLDPNNTCSGCLF